ncbi:hypothetical protein ACFFQW_30040 [Umezawaea endophytica]|jgi:hypothetical protein|uniref:DUF5709 domain-containing protein n=1 Tax=Umezawaea endophytica TaxID=1654476 RepID=A0A9X2VS51_9PSEU|nr:hypothetical protein [Umezawaea endophytica]MCS7481821.1 hypothetical protein [Umezawaea endophytica]
MTDPNENPLDTTEETDEDELGADPLDEGYEAPDHWSGANKFGTTSAEQRAGEPLDERLKQEEPDVGP